MRGWIICKRCWLIFGRDEVTPNVRGNAHLTAAQEVEDEQQ